MQNNNDSEDQQETPKNSLPNGPSVSDNLLRKVEAIGASFSKALVLTLWDEIKSNLIQELNSSANGNSANVHTENDWSEDYPMHDDGSMPEEEVLYEDGEEVETGDNVNAAASINNVKHFPYQEDEDEDESNWPVEHLDDS